jgi:hypothetical protein
VVTGAEWRNTITLISDVEAAEDKWYATHGVVGVNHMICVRSEIAAHPDLTAEVYRMFCDSHHLVLGPQDQRRLRGSIPGAVREGYARIRPAVALVADYARRQRLIEHAPDPAELFPQTLIEGIGR